MISPFAISGQIVGDARSKQLSDSIRKEFDNGPYFTLYKDTYLKFDI